jgi:TrmH family RNA methyltransferase
MTEITSPHNPRVKAAMRLRDRRHREKQGRILIDGVRELTRAIAAGVRMIEVFVCEPLLAADESQQTLTILRDCGGEILTIAEQVFAKVAFGQRADGVLGVAEIRVPTLADVDARLGWSGGAPSRRTQSHCVKTGRSEIASHEQSGRSETASYDNGNCALVAILESVEKPGNLGAVLRSADGAGLDALIAADLRTDLYNPNAIRASLGTIFTLPVAVADSRETLDWLRGRGLAIVAARVDGSVPYTEVDYRRPTAIVFGSEAEGLSEAWRAPDVTAVRLPMLGAADSLNVSAAAAVLFYEARRQRM